VHTEDHPLEYVDFEDVIPEGSYGAGAMIAWDTGRVTYLETSAEKGLETGKIDFLLHGYKLNGRFALVRTKRGEGNDWLLIKKLDAHSREPGEIIEEAPWSVLSGLTVEQLPARRELAGRLESAALDAGALARELDLSAREPMLCAHEGARLDDSARLYELKLDGVRVLADKRAGTVTLRYRNGGNCSASYPEVVRAVEALPGERLALDGEVVAFDERGRPNFQRILPRIQARRAADVARAAAEVPVVYLAFDLLALNSADLTELPLRARKRLLAELLRGRGLVRILDHIEGRGTELFALCEAEGLEGVVAKKQDSPYRFGPRRGDDWVKLKRETRENFVIAGWVETKNMRGLGSLCLASYAGGRLVYRGKVGTGFDDAMLRRLSAEVVRLKTSESALSGSLPDEVRQAHWVRPELVAQVRFQGFTDDGRLRAPVFLEIAEGVAPESCTARPRDEESLAELPEEPPPPEEERALVSRPGLTLSNREKVFWPEEGYTKGDLLDYYARIAPVMLSFLERRPVVLVRHPDGISGKSFYQWNIPRGTPDWMRRLTLRDPEDPSHDKTVFLVDDTASLLYLVNLGCIPLHVLACREGSRDACDFLTIDLDLNEQPFGRAVEIALTARDILTEAGLEGFPKTSGQGGLHLLVPLGAGVPFEAAKLLVELLGRLITARHSEFATMERRIDKRGGRLYVDTGQTGTSRTIVAPYSVRAAPGATVSTPLFWEELSGALDPRRFTILTVPDRVAELGDPFAAIFDSAPDIADSVGRLERLSSRSPRR
jgi:bifunctional non-homologous end joining protein LigD